MRMSDWSSDVCSSDLHVEVDVGDVGLVEEEVSLLAQVRQRVLGERGQLLAHRLAGGLDASFEQLHRLAVAARHHLATTEHISPRTEEHTSELQSLMRTSYTVICLKKK